MRLFISGLLRGQPVSKLEHDAGAAKHRTEFASRLDKPWYRSSSELLADHGAKNLRCLDLCCGNGEFSTILRDRHGMEVICADYVEYHLEHVRDQGFETFHVDIDADAREIDGVAARHAGTFDLVVSLAAIEHVFDSDNMLRFAHTVLKPGGCFWSTPRILLFFRTGSIPCLPATGLPERDITCGSGILGSCGPIFS
jgi:2-polyprenyl-3-methyl-5-hydroxy-6-metoxy-1,4-benzoquinol methylase